MNLFQLLDELGDLDQVTCAWCNAESDLYQFDADEVVCRHCLETTDASELESEALTPNQRNE